MDKTFCEQIDRDSLVEEYIQGRLPGDLRIRFEQHLLECDQHAMAVRMERILKKGVVEFARNQVRSSIIHRHHRPQEDLRVAILRYAAFLFVAVFVPLMLYYQFQVLQSSVHGITLPEKQILMEDDARTSIEKKQEQHPPAATSVISPSQVTGSGMPSPAESSVVLPPLSVTGTYDRQIINRDGAHPEKQAVPQTLPTESRTQAADKSLNALEQQPEKDKTYSVSGIKKREDQHRQDLIIFIKDEMASHELTQQIAQQISQREQELINCIPQKNTGVYFEIEFIISSQGLPADIKIIKTNSGSKQIDGCVIEKIKNWKFDTLDQEIVVKKYFTLHS